MGGGNITDTDTCQCRDPLFLGFFGVMVKDSLRLVGGSDSFAFSLLNCSLAMPDFSVAVNVFWRRHPPELYNPKDIYGNKDLPASDAVLAGASKLGQVSCV